MSVELILAALLGAMLAPVVWFIIRALLFIAVAPVLFAAGLVMGLGKRRGRGAG